MNQAQIKEGLKNVQARIDLYEAGKQAYTKTQVEDLYAKKNQLTADIKKACVHDHSCLKCSSWVDKGYGTDRTYYEWIVYCRDCDTELAKGAESESYNSGSTETMPLLDLVRGYPNLILDSTLEKLGITKHEKVVKTYTYSKRGY
jgi:hypothetical protein